MSEPHPVVTATLTPCQCSCHNSDLPFHREFNGKKLAEQPCPACNGTGSRYQVNPDEPAVAKAEHQHVVQEMRYAALVDEGQVWDRLRAAETELYGECPSGCGCVTEDDPDRKDCACDGPCTMADEWPVSQVKALNAEVEELREVALSAEMWRLALVECRREFVLRNEAEQYVHPHHATTMARMMRFEVKAGEATGYVRVDDAAWEAERIRDDALVAASEPWTTVTDTGEVMRVIPKSSWLEARDPDDGHLICNHGDRENCTRSHDTVILYRLIPVTEETTDEG